MAIIYDSSGRAREYSLLAANLYTGCRHGCRYCWVPAATRNRDFHKVQKPRLQVIERLAKEARKYAGTNRRILLCFTCDPYQPLDDTLQLTRKAIEILKRWDIPFQVLTKGALRAVRDFDLYQPGDAFATTLTFLDPGLSLQWERYAPAPAERIQAIAAAHARGIETWASLEPVIVPAQSLDIIEETHGIVDHYKIGKLNYKNIGVTYNEWRKFGMAAVRACEGYGKSYYIKTDLAKYLDGVTFHNTDTRTIQRKPPEKKSKKGLLFE